MHAYVYYGFDIAVVGGLLPTNNNTKNSEKLVHHAFVRSPMNKSYCGKVARWVIVVD